MSYVSSWYGAVGRRSPYFDYRSYLPQIREFGSNVLGYTQYQNTRKSAETQISYEQYLRRGNERALADWHKNLPGRRIRYPEFSYAGQIARADTAIGRLGYESDSAYANFYGNLPYRTAGLYGIGGRVARSL